MGKALMEGLEKEWAPIENEAVMTSTDSVFTDMISNSRWTSFKFVCLIRL